MELCSYIACIYVSMYVSIFLSSSLSLSLSVYIIYVFGYIHIYTMTNGFSNKAICTLELGEATALGQPEWLDKTTMRT